jgi:GTP:adenosylcobinamide-phosphate guanylyltransferase
MCLNDTRGLIEFASIVSDVPMIRDDLIDTLIKAMKAAEEAVRSMEARTYVTEIITEWGVSSLK